MSKRKATPAEIDTQAPNEERPWEDVWRHCPHCQRAFDKLQDEQAKLRAILVIGMGHRIEELEQINAELLAACEKLCERLEAIDPLHLISNGVKIARIIIAKAKGETP